MAVGETSGPAGPARSCPPAAARRRRRRRPAEPAPEAAETDEAAPLVKEADPELERLLAEEEEIERSTRGHHETPHFRPGDADDVDAQEGQAPQDQRGRLKGEAKGGTEVSFGDYGIQALEPGWITARQIEAARIAMTRHVRGGKVWINVFPHKPITQKPAETRMGSGKGNPEKWVAVVKPGRVLFELPTTTRTSPAGPSSGPSRSCPSRPASSPVRRASDGRDEAVRPERRRAARPAGRGQGGAVQPALPARHRPVDQHTRIGQVRKQVARIITELRDLEIAAAEALAADEEPSDGRRPTWPGKGQPDRSQRKVREGAVVSDKMDRTSGGGRDQPGAPPPVQQDGPAQRRASTSTTRPTTRTSATGSASRRPSLCPS